MTHLYEFAARLDRRPSLAEINAFYAAGLDDCAVENLPVYSLLHVARRAPSLVKAIVSIWDDTKAAGFTIVGLEAEEPFGLALSDLVLLERADALVRAATSDELAPLRERLFAHWPDA